MDKPNTLILLPKDLSIRGRAKYKDSDYDETCLELWDFKISYRTACAYHIVMFTDPILQTDHIITDRTTNFKLI